MENLNNEKKLGGLSLSCVFMAYFCSITAVPTGGIVGAGADFKTGLIGIILGFIIGAVLISLSTWMGYKTGLKKDLLWKQMFGSQGFKICSGVIAFCMAFWACFDFFNAAQAMYNLMPEGYKNFGFCIAMVILLVVTILGGVFGVDGIKLISNLTIPIAIVLFVIIYFFCFKQVGGVETLMAYKPAQATLTIGAIAQMQVAMWMAGYCGAIDLTTRAKSTRSVITASICGSGFVFLCFLVGQVGFIGTGVQTLADICAQLGGGIFLIGSIFVMVAQGNTTPACDYMYSNSFSEVLHINRKIVAIVVPFIAAILAFVIMYGPGVDFINVIVGTIGTLMGPLFGVMVADFYIIRKKHLEIKDEADLPKFRACPLLCMAFGFALALVLKLFPAVPVQTFVVLIVTMIVYVIADKLVLKKHKS